MCVSVGQADFFGTTVMVAPAVHPQTGRRIVVMAYQNTAVNRSDGPNAMLLHFPSRTMTRENVVGTEPFKGFLDGMVQALQPRGRGHDGTKGLLSLDMPRRQAEVFNHGIYTIVLGQSAESVMEALERVPVDRRPNVGHKLIQFYGRQFGAWNLALCCFNNRDARKATPMMWWYEPTEASSGLLHLPAIDAHTGEEPNMLEKVDVDHWVIVGSKGPRPDFQHFDYRRPLTHFDPFVDAIMPNYIAGRHFGGRMDNGDFYADPSVSEGSGILRGTEHQLMRLA